MKVLVCGGRDYADKARVNEALGIVHRKCKITELIHGAARGADTLADEWAKENGIKVSAYPADWEKHKKAAGPIRNQKMLDDAKPEAVVAFPGGSGTKDMLLRAQLSGLKIWKPYG